MNLRDAKYGGCARHASTDDRCGTYAATCPSHEFGFIYVAKVVTRYRAISFETKGEPLHGWKVGFTTNLPVRIKGLLVDHCNRVTLVALMRGTQDEEEALHQSLKHLWMGRHMRGSPARYGRDWYIDHECFRAWLRRTPAVWRGWLTCVNRGKRGVKWEGRRPRSGHPRIAAVWDRVNAPLRSWATCPATTFNTTTEAA